MYYKTIAAFQLFITHVLRRPHLTTSKTDRVNSLKTRKFIIIMVYKIFLLYIPDWKTTSKKFNETSFGHNEATLPLGCLTKIYVNAIEWLVLFCIQLFCLPICPNVFILIYYKISRKSRYTYSIQTHIGTLRSDCFNENLQQGYKNLDINNNLGVMRVCRIRSVGSIDQPSKVSLNLTTNRTNTNKLF